jgi:hypothetical protein
MGLWGRSRSRQRSPVPSVANSQPFWSPGPVPVTVVGESYYAAAVSRAQQFAASGAEMVGELVPEPSNPHDRNAVAVLVLGDIVGHLPSELAPAVQHALISRLAPYGGRLGGRVEVQTGNRGPEIVVWIDPAPIGLRPDQLHAASAMAAQVQSLLPQMTPARAGRGVDVDLRAELAELNKRREQVEADYDRPASAWPRLERQFRDLAARLDRAEDPAAGIAWIGVAHSTRYQKGRRADVLAAFAEGLRRDPNQVDAWCELLDYTAWSPDVGALMQVLQSAPVGVRPNLVPTLLSISRGTDRGGRMSPTDGERLRAGMLSAAEKTEDRGCLAVLYADLGKQSAKVKDDEAAYEWWRRALAAGCTEPQVVDHVSVRLVQGADFEGAATALRSSLARDDVARTLRERMEKRLARCERESDAQQLKPGASADHGGVITPKS